MSHLQPWHRRPTGVRLFDWIAAGLLWLILGGVVFTMIALAFAGALAFLFRLLFRL